MVDLAPGVESKNYGLSKGIELKTLFELFKVVLPLILIACVLSFHVWVRAENIRMGYECQRAEEQIGKLQNAGRQLLVQEQILRDPKLMDSMARNNLGMIILRANQVVPVNPNDRGALEVGSLYRSGWSKAPAALN